MPATSKMSATARQARFQHQGTPHKIQNMACHAKNSSSSNDTSCQQHQGCPQHHGCQQQQGCQQRLGLINSKDSKHEKGRQKCNAKHAPAYSFKTFLT
jgi:hypothetical protein